MLKSKNKKNKFISFALVIIMIFSSLSMMSTTAFAIDSEDESISIYYQQFLDRMEEDEDFRQFVLAAEEMGIEFVDIKRSKISEAELNNMRSFETETEFFTYVEAQQAENIISFTTSDIIESYAAQTGIMPTSSQPLPTGHNTVTLTEWAPGMGAFTWRNITLDFTVSYTQGQLHLGNVSVNDSFYSGLTIGLYRTHNASSSYFSGVTLITSVAMTTRSGTAYAVGVDETEINLFGIPIVQREQRTFEMFYMP